MSGFRPDTKGTVEDTFFFFFRLTCSVALWGGRDAPFEDLGCFSGYLMSSAGIQKLFCGIYSAFKCSSDEFVGEKAFSPSYSSAILAPPPFSSLLFNMILEASTSATGKKNKRHRDVCLQLTELFI